MITAMKKIFNLLLVCLAVTMYSSCSPKEDDIFEDSSANRMTEALKNDKDILTSAANGWIVQYYPSSTQAYGGYNLLVKFNADGSAVVASECADPSATETSTYSLAQSAGPVLSFTSYNSIMHYFSDPVNPDNIGAKGKGMEGDFEFRLMEVSAEKVVMMGKKTNSRIVMLPMNASTSWKDYLMQVAAARLKMGFGQYQYVAGTDTANVTMSYNTMVMSYSKDGTDVTETVPYIVTPTGYLLYDTLKVGGVNVTELTYKGGATHEFVSDGTGAAKLYGVIVPLNQLLVGGTNWYFAYSNLSDYGKPYWDKASADLLSKEQESLRYMYISSTNLRFRSGSYNGYLTLTVTTSGDDTISFKLKGYDSNGKYYWKGGYLQYFTYPLLKGTTGRTFTLTADNIQNPQVIILTDASDATNNFKLTKAVQSPPL
jgi:hypothetical protein